MVDRTKLEEALAVFDSWTKMIAERYPEAHTIEPAPTYALLAEAARVLLEFPTEEMILALASSRRDRENECECGGIHLNIEDAADDLDAVRDEIFGGES